MTRTTRIHRTTRACIGRKRVSSAAPAHGATACGRVASICSGYNWEDVLAREASLVDLAEIPEKANDRRRKKQFSDPSMRLGAPIDPEHPYRLIASTQNRQSTTGRAGSRICPKPGSVRMLAWTCHGNVGRGWPASQFSFFLRVLRLSRMIASLLSG
jgi:hypothetical protein